MSSILEESRLLPRVVLIACGSFSPPTPMHFRMFEIARDHITMQGTHQVIGGIMSPTHDLYGKKGLALGKHRYAMVKLALQSSPWIRVSDWEISQSQWSRTQSVLQHHQNAMNNYINTRGYEADNEAIPGWFPSGLRDREDPIKLKLLCGADLLESFAVPGLWADEDIEDIVENHGLVVISRSGGNPEKFIFDSDVLTKHQKHITLVTNWISNDISSTMIRRLLGRGQSVKYLIDDFVLEYIKTNCLFGFKSKYITDLTRPSQNVFNIEFMNQVNMSVSSNANTLSKDGNDDNYDDDDDDTEHMDESDYSLKNILTNINLDNRKVFCCGENDKVGSKLLQKSTRPGQAVKVITTERGLNGERIRDSAEEKKSKRLKIASIQDV